MSSPPPPSRDARAQAWLAGFVPGLRVPLRRAVALGTVSGALVVAQAALIAQVGSVALQAHPWWRQALPWLLGLLPVFALRFALVRASERVAFHAGAELRRRLRGELLAHLQRLGPLWLRGAQRGDLLNSLVNGIEALEAYFARYLPTARVTALVPAAILLAVFPVDWVSGLILLSTAPLIPLFMWLIGRGAEDLNQQQWLRLARLSARFLDTLQGLGTLKLLGASRREAAVVEQVSEEYRAATMRVLRVAFLSSVVLEFLSTVSIALVAVLVGFRLMWGQMHFLQGFFVLLLAPEFYAPLRALGGVYHLRMEAIGAARRIQPLLELAPPDPLAGAAPPPAGAPEIEFDGVACAYDDGRVGRRGCSLRVPAGRVTAVVGASGSGKSTLLALLLGLARPRRGSIRVNGVELDRIDPAAWLRGVSVLPQHPHLFAASIADNLRLADPDADPAALRRAARDACAEDFIDALAQGFDTLLGERGAGLSGGQLQRVALARALLRDAPLMLLDEPTASLDGALEQQVLDGLRPALRGRTVLMVAHRLRSLELADHVLVLEQGRVVEQGTPAQLAAAGAAFARLWQAQTP
ncbi:MAG: thiol reductant ABC exporter subunit CydD [Betaproteobacteria bacterium]|nr:thiol reductant ABC exporter subunit CydD [Betaproteobacteria bacterium]